MASSPSTPFKPTRAISQEDLPKDKDDEINRLNKALHENAEENADLRSNIQNLQKKNTDLQSAATRLEKESQDAATRLEKESQDARTAFTKEAEKTTAAKIVEDVAAAKAADEHANDMTTQYNKQAKTATELLDKIYKDDLDKVLCQAGQDFEDDNQLKADMANKNAGLRNEYLVMQGHQLRFRANQDCELHKKTVGSTGDELESNIFYTSNDILQVEFDLGEVQRCSRDANADEQRLKAHQTDFDKKAADMETNYALAVELQETTFKVLTETKQEIRRQSTEVRHIRDDMQLQSSRISIGEHRLDVNKTRANPSYYNDTFAGPTPIFLKSSLERSMAHSQAALRGEGELASQHERRTRLINIIRISDQQVQHLELLKADLEECYGCDGSPSYGLCSQVQRAKEFVQKRHQFDKEFKAVLGVAETTSSSFKSESLRLETRHASMRSCNDSSRQAIVNVTDIQGNMETLAEGKQRGRARMSYNHLSFCNHTCANKCNPARNEYTHKSFCNRSCANRCNPTKAATPSTTTAATPYTLHLSPPAARFYHYM